MISAPDLEALVETENQALFSREYQIRLMAGIASHAFPSLPTVLPRCSFAGETSLGSLYAPLQNLIRLPAPTDYVAVGHVLSSHSTGQTLDVLVVVGINYTQYSPRLILPVPLRTDCGMLGQINRYLERICLLWPTFGSASTNNLHLVMGRWGAWNGWSVTQQD
jgi:hypothetical protein